MFHVERCASNGDQRGAKARNSRTMWSPKALPAHPRWQGQPHSSKQKRSPQNEVHRQDPGSVHPCPARSVTFLSVIYTILTHNPFSGESGVIETFAPAIDYPQFVGVGSRAVNDFVW